MPVAARLTRIRHGFATHPAHNGRLGRTGRPASPQGRNCMDRRSFVAGSAAAAAALATGPSFAQDAYPSRAGHPDQSVPAGRRRRRGRPSVRGRAGADRQAAGGDRDQGRRRRAVGAQFAANAKPDGYTLLVHIVVDLRLRRGRQAVRPAAQVHARRLHPDRALHRRADGARRQRQAALQDAEGAGRRRQEAAQQDRLQLVRPLRRAASADRAVHEGGRHQDAASADQWRRPGADRHARQQFAGAGRRRSPPANAQIKAGKLRALACYSATSARRRCPTCRP